MLFPKLPVALFLAALTTLATSTSASACIVENEVAQILDLQGGEIDGEGRVILPYCRALKKKLSRATDPQKHECNYMGPQIMEARAICRF